MTPVLCGTGFLAWFSLVEAVTRRLRVDREVSRKFVHLTAGLTAAVVMPLVLSRGEIVVLSLLFAAAMAVSRRLAILRSIHDVERATWGEVSLPLGVAAAAALAPGQAAYTFAVAVVAVSDVAACAAGRRLGGPRLPGGARTYAGSAAFVVAAIATGMLLLPGAPLAVLAVAVVTAAAEAVSARGLDNLAVPLTAALVLSALR